MRRPHIPEILEGLRLRFCSLAMRMETGANSLRKLEQQRFLPHGP
jgi:hypothetical protein